MQTVKPHRVFRSSAEETSGFSISATVPSSFPFFGLAIEEAKREETTVPRAAAGGCWGFLLLFPSLRRLERGGTPAPCPGFVHFRVRVSGAVVWLWEAAAHGISVLRPHPLLDVVSGGGEGLGGVVSRRSVGSGELVPVVGVGVVEAPVPRWAFVLRLLLCRGGAGVSSGSIGKLVRLCRRPVCPGFFPVQGSRYVGGRSGTDSSFRRRLLLDLEAEAPWPKVDHRLMLRRSTADKFCFLKALRCFSVQGWGSPFIFFPAGLASGREWCWVVWRFSCFAAVALVLFRQCVPVCVRCRCTVLLSC